MDAKYIRHFDTRLTAIEERLARMEAGGVRTLEIARRTEGWIFVALMSWVIWLTGWRGFWGG